MSAEVMLVRAYAGHHPEEVARFIERLPPEGGAEVLAALDAEVAAEVLAHAVPLIGSSALAKLPNEDAAQVLEACHPSLAAGLLFRLAHSTRARLLEGIAPGRAEELRRMTEYGPRRAGGRLDPRAPAVPESLSVAEVLERLRAAPAGVMHYVYSIDEDRRLTGVVNMRELMLASPEAPLSTIVTRDPEALFAHDPLEVVARHAAWKRSHALPVVDRDRRLLGALRYSTFRAIETELGQAAAGPDTDQTASALAELCTVGASAMARFIGAAFSVDPVGPERRSEPPPPSIRRSVLPPTGGLP